MENILALLLRKVLHFFLSRRYEVEVRGMEKIEGNGLLLLANHVSALDAAIFQVFTWKRFHARPFATSRFTSVSFLKPMFKLIRAITVPDCTVAKNSVKVLQLEKSYKEVLEGLKNGDNILFYPAGHLKISGVEKLGGQSGLHTLLSRNPNIRLALVRTTGLWGSRFSPAPHGMTPDLKKEVLDGLKTWFKHFLFPPKRKVTIELEPYTAPNPLPGRKELNQQLERWYNAPHGERGEAVCPSFAPVPFFPHVEGGEMTPLEKEVAAVMASIARCPVEQINKDTHLFYDLGLDSLEATELFDLIEQKYHLSHLYSPELITPYHIALQIEGRWRSHRYQHAVEKDKKRLNKLSSQNVNFKEVKTYTLGDVLRALKKSELKFVAYDEFLGLLSPKALLKRMEFGIAKALSDSRVEIPLLFPYSFERAVATLAVYFAGKKPLILNPKDSNFDKGIIYSSEPVVREWHGWDMGEASHQVQEFFSGKGEKPQQKTVPTQFCGGQILPPLAILKDPKEEAVFEALVSGVPILSGRSHWIDEVLK